MPSADRMVPIVGLRSLEVRAGPDSLVCPCTAAGAGGGGHAREHDQATDQGEGGGCLVEGGPADDDCERRGEVEGGGGDGDVDPAQA